MQLRFNASHLEIGVVHFKKTIIVVKIKKISWGKCRGDSRALNKPPRHVGSAVEVILKLSCFANYCILSSRAFMSAICFCCC